MDRELATRRCLNHWQREAVARCPECKRYFCRECVTEHEDRLLCATCIRNLKKETEGKRSSDILLRGIQLVMSFLILWTIFYYLGKALLLMPDEFHEGTVWQEDAS